MKKTTCNLISLIAALFLLNACSGNKTDNPFALKSEDDIKLQNIVRIDKEIADYVNLDTARRKTVLSDNYELLKGLAQFTDGVDSVDNNLMLVWSTSEATERFMPEVNKVFDNLSAEEKAFGRILATAKKNNLNIPVECFAAVTWADTHSINVMDTIKTAYLALNHYLGAEHEAYTVWPDYLRVLKNRDMIPVDMSEALIGVAYPYQPGENATILSRLLYEGALSVAKEAMVPDAPLSSILGFSPDAFQQVVDNEDFMWKQLAKEKMLYSTDSELMSNLFDPRPTSSRISDDAPGRAVRYIGYKLVKDYISSNPNVTLKFLLSPAFYTDGANILKSAHY